MQSFAVPVFILTTSAVLATPAVAGVTSQWVGRSGGAWSTGSNWSAGIPGSPGVPNGSVTVTRGLLNVTIDTWVSMAALTIGDGCTLSQVDNRDVSITSLQNDGVWALNSGGNHTEIQLNADLTFLGSGVISMGNHPDNRISSIGTQRVLTNGPNHTIRGAGNIGTNNTGLINDGVVEATQPAGLFIDLSDSLSLENNNLVQSTSGSSLTIYGTNVANQDGVIRADDSPTYIRYGSVTGGLLQSLGSGEFITTTEPTSLVDVTLDGQLRMPDNADTVLVGTFTNDGVVVMQSGGNHTELRLNSDPVTFAGTGVVSMGNHGDNRITSTVAPRTLVNGASHTIRGAGNIGTNNTGLVNNGLIEATEPAGLVIDLSDSLSLDNNNVIQSKNGSTLTIYGTNVSNEDGVIRADESPTYVRYGSITGGLLESIGVGEFITTTEPTTLVDVTLDGQLRMPDNADTVLVGTFTNDGTVVMQSGGNHTELRLNSDVVTLAGPGVISMGNHPDNRITSIVTPRTLVNGADHTIRGAGNIGTNNTGLVNEGLIEATEPAGLLIDLADSLPLDNNGVLQSKDGSTLTIYGTNVDNVDGVIRADEGKTYVRYGSITGGLLESFGSGEFVVTPEPTTLVDVTLDGQLRMPDNADTVLIGTLTNDGVVAMQSGGNHTELRLNSPTVTLAGSGILSMGSHSDNRITSVVAARTLVNAFGHSIRGSGNIGTNNTSIQNAGLVEADQTVQLFFDPLDSGTSFNEGTLRVSGSGGMTMYFGSWFNKGTVDIDPTRTFTRHGGYTQTDGNTIVDGTLSLVSGGYTQTGGLLSGDGTVQGNVLISGGSSSPSGADGSDLGSLNVAGTYAQDNDGGYVVDLAASGNDLLTVTGAATLGGALQVRLVNSFVPVVGQEFVVLTAANINGFFGCVEFPNAPAGYFSLIYSQTEVKLVVASKPVQEADLNFDGVVNAEDLGILLGAWGNDPCDNAICCPADLNGDGKVDGSDLAILLGSWS